MHLTRKKEGGGGGERGEGGASLVAQLVKNPPVVQETWIWSLGWEDPLEKRMATHSTLLPGESHGKRSLVGYSSWGQKEFDMTEQLSTHSGKKKN